MFRYPEQVFRLPEQVFRYLIPGIRYQVPDTRTSVQVVRTLNTEHRTRTVRTVFSISPAPDTLTRCRSSAETQLPLLLKVFQPSSRDKPTALKGVKGLSAPSLPGFQTCSYTVTRAILSKSGYCGLCETNLYTYPTGLLDQQASPKHIRQVLWT